MLHSQRFRDGEDANCREKLLSAANIDGAVGQLKMSSAVGSL